MSAIGGCRAGFFLLFLRIALALGKGCNALTARQLCVLLLSRASSEIAGERYHTASTLASCSPVRSLTAATWDFGSMWIDHPTPP